MFEKIIEEELNKQIKKPQEDYLVLYPEDFSEVAKAISDKIGEICLSGKVQWKGKSFKQYEEENRELKESIKILNSLKVKE